MSYLSLLNRSLFALILAVSLISCGGDDDSNSGGGQQNSDQNQVIPNLEAKVVGPNLNGDTWAGYFKSVEGKFAPMTAVINHEGNKVTILTSLEEGVAHKLTGVIDSIGNTFLVDKFDGEDWTSLYGPVSKNSINLADYVFIDGQSVDTNIIILKR